MPRTSRPLQVLPIILREVEVTGIADITPNMRRLTVAGDQLAEADVDGMARPAFRSEGFDDHVKLVIPPPDGTDFDIGEQEEFRFKWNREALNRARDYTVRSVDPENNSFTFDVVRHDSGLASDWAFGAAIGQRISFAGPKTCAGLADGIDFNLLVADETALPAVGRWLEEAPAGTRGHIIVEVPTADDIQDIPTEADVEIDWLIRGSTAPGESTLLYEAVKNLDLPAGRTFAWCAGETLTIAPIRRYLRRDVGLPKEDVEVVGYWRKLPAERRAEVGSHTVTDQSPVADRSTIAEAAAPTSGASPAAGAPTSGTVTAIVSSPGSMAGTSSTDGTGSTDGAAASASPESSLDVLEQVHEMTEILPPIITRAAVTFGLNDLIAGGITTAEAIAAETGIDTDGIRVVLTAMCSLGLLEREGEGYRNTPTGAVLTSEGSADGLDLGDSALLDLFSIVDLIDVLRGGFAARTSRASATQALTWHDQRAADENLDAAHRSRTLDHLRYVLDIILDLEPIATASSVALTGDAGAEVAAALTRKAPESGRTIHTPAAAAALTGEQAWPKVEATLVLAGLTGRSRVEARGLLARVIENSDSLVVVEPFTDEAEVDDHQAEELVATFTTTGHASWTSREVRELLVELGIASVDVVDIGWGFGRFHRAVIAGRR
ncbi:MULTISPECIES: siderophore-interacting protein [unclassified Brevibacterium]|uniref:siderophore-interacting protein n=1 Tax=unclassified Brevibacterium TaxID=2614124 RepID=UPI001091D844|nr:siderophore-interacting protein [Brevibacterium sp. S22]TGD32796.1 siderophore-interacting protein [Brevibacterium sp. S22]